MLDERSTLGELIPCGGGDPIPLLKPRLLVGRRSRCDIALRFPNVSSHHCELEFLDGYWFVRDMNSRNGVKVNDTRCETQWLMPGDVLSVAKHRYEIVYTPVGDAPPPELDEDPFARGLLEKAGLERKRLEKFKVDDSDNEQRPKKKSLDISGPLEWPPKDSSLMRTDRE